MIEPRTTRRFREAYRNLPEEIRRHARQAYLLFRKDPHHPSLQFKKVDEETSTFSLRLGLDYRALGVMEGSTDDSPPATSTSGDCTPSPGALRCNPRGGIGERGELAAHPVSAQDGACHVVGKEISVDCTPRTAADAGSTWDASIGKLHGGSNVEGLRFAGS